MTTETITWHRVSDRLPDDDTTVLVHMTGGSEPVWLGYRDCDIWRDIDSCYIGGEVVAWADLPEGVA